MYYIRKRKIIVEFFTSAGAENLLGKFLINFFNLIIILHNLHNITSRFA